MAALREPVRTRHGRQGYEPRAAGANVIIAYHRPETVQDALNLINRTSPRTVLLGGGTLLSHGDNEPVEVVDLQALGLNQIREQGKNLEIGATATLQALLEHASCPEAL